MKRGQLADNFVGVGMKRLSAVDAEPSTSNQHEVGTTGAMRRDFLGEEHKKEFQTTYFWLSEEQEAITDYGTTTHYDARRTDPKRSPEWRLYYKSNHVTAIMKPGDSLFLARTIRGDLLFIVAPRESSGERQLVQLFGFQPKDESFVSQEFRSTDPELDFAARYLLDELDIELAEPDADLLDATIARFGKSFPSVTEFSTVARDSLPDINAGDDPDTALLAWLEREKALYLRLERHILAETLERGFVNDGEIDVEAFLSLSNSVMNRRKSRMGQSFENQVEAVIRAHKLEFERGAVTENNNKPDFLFPGINAYSSLPHGDTRLVMLGAKSTCKERWRQVLTEASKIPDKHLLTLERGISENQTAQMRDLGLSLVVPFGLHSTYTSTQRKGLWSIQDFIDFVRDKQQQS